LHRARRERLLRIGDHAPPVDPDRAAEALARLAGAQGAVPREVVRLERLVRDPALLAAQLAREARRAPRLLALVLDAHAQAVVAHDRLGAVLAVAERLLERVDEALGFDRARLEAVDDHADLGVAGRERLFSLAVLAQVQDAAVLEDAHEAQPRELAPHVPGV